MIDHNPPNMELIELVPHNPLSDDMLSMEDVKGITYMSAALAQLAVSADICRSAYLETPLRLPEVLYTIGVAVWTSATLGKYLINRSTSRD